MYENLTTNNCIPSDIFLHFLFFKNVSHYSFFQSVVLHTIYDTFSFVHSLCRYEKHAVTARMCRCWCYCLDEGEDGECLLIPMQCINQHRRTKRQSIYGEPIHLQETERILTACDREGSFKGVGRGNGEGSRRCRRGGCSVFVLVQVGLLIYFIIFWWCKAILQKQITVLNPAFNTALYKIK